MESLPYFEDLQLFPAVQPDTVVINNFSVYRVGKYNSCSRFGRKGCTRQLVLEWYVYEGSTLPTEQPIGKCHQPIVVIIT